MVVWDKNNYTSEADKQVSDTDVNRDFKFNEKIFQNLFEESNMKILNIKPSLQKQNSSNSSVSTRKLGTLRKFITFNVSSVLGRPVISNCWTLREEISSLLDFCIKPTMDNVRHTLGPLLFNKQIYENKFTSQGCYCSKSRHLRFIFVYSL